MKQTHLQGEKSSTIYTIQYLRAFAAILVLIWHIKGKSAHIGGDLLSGYDFGFAGVDVFFVISGFVMSFIYSRSKVGYRSLATFWSRRFVRIVPLYWLLTCVALAIYLIDPAKVNSSGGTTSIWKSFLLIPGPDKFLIENGWTLSYEMYFYALFSFAFLFTDKLRGALAVCALIVALGAGNLFRPIVPPFLTDPILLEFAFGVVIFLIFDRASGTSGIWMRRVGVISLVAGVAGLIAVKALDARYPYAKALTVGIPAALIVFGVVAQESWLRRAPSALLAGLGDSSYSMYLFHPFVLSAAAMIFTRLHLGQRGSVVEMAYWAMVVAGVLIASWLLYRYVETPLNRMVRSAASRIGGRGAQSARVPTA
ncbi:acyltransferase [Caballeronia sp. BR00000012568055]|uniref:acyltransferase family protein n=1 Tax=Caballeronia sp. BR00000012568055 TaxID=2918761 RepID=UPI0023F971CB|nr:acyltransferase [Caballeronia sp. BR00000012568055]